MMNEVRKITINFTKRSILKVIRNCLITLLILLPIPVFLFSLNSYQLSFPDEKLPFVQFSGRNPRTEAIITWETTENEPSMVWYGQDSDHLTMKASDSKNLNIHRIILTNLDPDTKYYYRVGFIELEVIYRSPIFSFKTAPDNENTAFKFCAYADSQQLYGMGWHQRICNAIAKYDDLSFVLEAGDLCQNWDYKPDWNQFFNEASVYMKKYSFVPNMGNHDGYYPDDDPNAKKHWYEQYFGATNTGSDPHSFYYCFEWANSIFISAEISKTGDENPKTERNRCHDIWLNNTLKNGQQKAFRILFFHRQVFSAEDDNEMLINRIVPIVEKYNVSLVLYGHHHHYERFLYHNITYVCLGGGGGQQLGEDYFKTGEYSEKFSLGPFYSHFSINSEEIKVKTLTPENDIIDDFCLKLNGSRAILAERM